MAKKLPLVLANGRMQQLQSTDALDETTLLPDSIVFVQLAATPANPPAGRVRVYAKLDGNFYQLDSGGVETQL